MCKAKQVYRFQDLGSRTIILLNFWGEIEEFWMKSWGYYNVRFGDGWVVWID